MTYYDDPKAANLISEVEAKGFSPHAINGKSEHPMYCGSRCSCGPARHLHGKVVRRYRNSTTGEVEYLVVGELDVIELTEFERNMESMSERIGKA